jgi:hypothetical protein
MVITDGLQQTKSSAVDRSASRGSLEKRFGVTLQDHIRERGGRALPTSQVKQVVDQVRGLERREWLAHDLAAATRERDAARARLDGFEWARERAAATTRTMERALTTLYRNPADARAAILTAERERGADRAVEALRTHPEQFGPLLAAERRGLLGVISLGSSRPAPEKIAHAAEAVREALQARSAVPHERLVILTELQLRHAERRVASAEHRLAAEPERGHALARIGTTAMQVDRTGAKALKAELGRAQFQTVLAARRAMQQVQRLSRSMAPEQAREVVAWMTAPQKQLPRAVRRAIRDTILDRDRERGLS